MTVRADLLIKNTSQVVTVQSNGKPKSGGAMSELGIIRNGAVASYQGSIVWTGSETEMDESVNFAPDTIEIDANGCAVLPGFVDPHTHLVFAGTREDEFALKIAGVPYMEIAAKGGGIKRTVRTTREASESSLLEVARTRIIDALRYGITCIEIKSGYGLNTDTETKILRIATALKNEFPVEIARTFLGAHEIPAGIARESYIDQVCNEMIPLVAKEKLADFCDVFCERNVYTVEESRKILTRGKEYGLLPKIHADQMSCIGASRLAGEIEAVSADHLDYIDDEGVISMKKGGTIAVLLPGAVFFLGLKQYAPARKLIEAGLPVALATDFNPGSCMTLNYPAVMTIAATQCRMKLEEIICACTINAACSIGKQSICGSLETGKRADIVVLDTPSYQTIPYHFGHNHFRHVICNGKWIIRDFQYQSL